MIADGEVIVNLMMAVVKLDDKVASGRCAAGSGTSLSSTTALLLPQSVHSPKSQQWWWISVVVDAS